MGNLCCGGNLHPPLLPESEQPTGQSSSHQTFNTSESTLLQTVERIRLYHKDRIRRELENDPQVFILDNLLMCIQFFDNFDKAVVAANEFRRNTEREMNELLAKDPHEGMILGDRKIKLLSGMSHILAQNFIYRGKNHADDDESDIDSYYGGIGLKDTFMNEGIIASEFVMTWSNLELYDHSELETVKDYSDAKGASPSARFCMEQPDNGGENAGYVRLMCVDEPISHRKQLQIPEGDNSPDFGYAVEHIYSKPDSDGGSEVPVVESDGTAPSSGATSDEDDVMNLPEILKKIPSTRVSSVPGKSNVNLPSTSRAGFFKPPLSKLITPSTSTDINDQFPSLVVHAPTPPVYEGQLEIQPFEEGLLAPHTKPGRILNQYSRLPGNYSAELPSSGYDTTSSTVSQSSSVASELMRDKWQKQNVNRLWDFKKKSRKDQISVGGRYEPVPDDCIIPMKIEISYDAPIDEDEEDETEESEEDEEDDTDKSSDEEEFNFSSGKLERKRKNQNPEDEYKLRFYLDSLQFSSNACSEFHYIGPCLSIPMASINNGVVVGTTIRCPIPYAFPTENETEDVGNYYVTYTFTPALHSKSWPANLYLHFNQQIFNRKINHGKMWPSREQMEQIELYGCYTLPSGYRSVGFFNATQMLEWELNFHDCETILLSSMHNPHWRTYIFSAILFRAFIAPLGPQGIGLEHIRNILYCMCYDDFYGWNDEQPGAQLSMMLGHLLECLGKGKMPSFFIPSRNLLQSIPQHNLRYVQGHLHQIRENIIVYCIYAFRNLVKVQKSENSYKFPNLKYLYEILTGQETELLIMINDRLKRQKDQEEEAAREKERKKASKKRKQQKPNLIDQQDEIEKSFRATQRELQNAPPKEDKVKKRLKRGYKNYQKKTKKEQQGNKDREAQRLKEDPEYRLPDAEKRQSIDLGKVPISIARPSPLRILLLIKSFIENFLDMAKMATTMHSYGQATMYLLQVENLCEICQEDRYANGPSPFEEEDFDKYREETLRLRGILGSDMEQYVIEKIAPISQRSPPSPAQFLNEPVIGSTDFPTFTNNWDLRKLPTPPPSLKDIIPTGKKLEKPNMVNSLQSLDDLPRNPLLAGSAQNTPPPRIPADRNKPQRQESIKFVQSSISPRDTPPPATPPRSPGRLLARQSIMSISLDRDDDNEIESTDL